PPGSGNRSKRRAWRSRSSASSSLAVLLDAAAQKARQDDPLDAGRLATGDRLEVRVEAEQEDGRLARRPRAGVLDKGIKRSRSIQHDANPGELMFDLMVGTAGRRVK